MQKNDPRLQDDKLVNQFAWIYVIPNTKAKKN